MKERSSNEAATTASRKEPLIIESLRSADSSSTVGSRSQFGRNNNNSNRSNLTALPSIDEEASAVASVSSVGITKPPMSLLSRKRQQQQQGRGVGGMRPLLLPPLMPHCASSSNNANNLASPTKLKYTPPDTELVAATKQDALKLDSSLPPRNTIINTTNTTTAAAALAASSTPTSSINNAQKHQQQNLLLPLGEPAKSTQESLHSVCQQLLGDQIATKIPYQQYSAICKHWCTMSTGLMYFLIFLVTAAGMVYGVSVQLSAAAINWEEELAVAFVGNTYFMVNDVPRLLEAISTGHVYQNSVLHAGGSLHDLWVRGNGMYKLWQTEEAVIEYYDYRNNNNNDDNDNDDDDAKQTTYDFGLCTVAQILQGYDEYVAYGNPYGHYYDDGLNPCFVDPYYASFVAQDLSSDDDTWDYVVLVDQTKRMAVPEARNSTIQVLLNGYGPLLKESGAVPVLVDTHAFWSSNSNMTGLTDIPTFTALVYEGVQEYVDTLASVLPRKQRPLVAPIGLAYLTVWEEDYNLWLQLFLDDQIHASLHGSYLLACVLYCTLFGHLPDEQVATVNVAALFMDARKLITGGQGQQPVYPTARDAEYLRNVARRVALRRHIPSSLNNNNRRKKKNRDF